MSLYSYAKSHVFLSSIIAFVAIFTAILTGRSFHATTTVETNQGVKNVTLVSAKTFREGNIDVIANGIVESKSQVDLRAQVSAPVSIINASVGDTVYAGQIILELQNSDIRAQLAQAQASLAVAQGQQQSGRVSLESARQGAIDTVRDAYNDSHDIVLNQIYPILFNNDGNGGRLDAYSTNGRLNQEIIDTYLDLKNSYDNWHDVVYAVNENSSLADIQAAIQLSEKGMSQTNLLLGDISSVLANLSVYAQSSFMTTLNNWKTIVSQARATASADDQGLNSTQATLSSTNNSEGTTLQAGVAAAAAGVRNLEAQLAKTVIRSPIYGKISTMPLRLGELASPGTLIASVVGEDRGLIVKAYVSGDDLPRVKTGAEVNIEGNIAGSVINVAPSVDPTTKKAEVDIEIPQNQSLLVIGENVSVTISSRANDVATNVAAVGNGAQKTSMYYMPIQNVKIQPGEAYVLTVDTNSKIVKNRVIIGNIIGDHVQIKSGLNDNMNIVSPVYELEEGDTVNVR